MDDEETERGDVDDGDGDKGDGEFAEELAAVAADLEALIERVDDLALEVLRAAVARGASARPEAEKRLQRLRGALQRARSHLERR